MHSHEDWIFGWCNRRYSTNDPAVLKIRARAGHPFTQAKVYPPRMKRQGAPVAKARVVRILPMDRGFYIGMAIRAIVVSALGFAPSLVNTAAHHVPH